MSESETDFKARSAAQNLPVTNWSESSVLKNIFATDMTIIAAVYDLLALDILPQFDIDQAAGIWIDAFLAELNETRKLATFAEYNQTFTREVAGSGNINIPVQTLVSTAENSAGDVFQFFVKTAGVLKDGVTGTGTISTTGTVVTGVGTLAGIEFDVGDEITASAQTKTIITKTDNLIFTINSAFSVDLTDETFTYKHESIKVPIIAEKAGATHNLEDGAISVIVATISGVDTTENKTGDQTLIAIDEETDDIARQRYKDTVKGKSRAGTKPAYIKLAKEIDNVIDVFVDDTLPRGNDTVDVYYTKTSGIPVFIAGAGTITGTTGSVIVTGVGTNFLNELAVGDTVKSDTGAIETVIKSIESNTQYTAKANPSGNFTTDNFTFVNTSEVQAKFDDDEEHILASDVEAKIPVAVTTNWNLAVKMHPDDGDPVTVDTKLREIINAFYVPDTNWPNVPLLSIGQDIQGASIIRSVLLLDDDGVLDVTFTAPASFPVVIAKNEKSVKGTVTINISRITL